MDENPKRKRPSARSIILYSLLAIVLIGIVATQLFNNEMQGTQENTELTTSEFVAAVNADMVDEFVYHAQSATIEGTYYKTQGDKKEGKKSHFTSTYIGEDSLKEMMDKHPDTKWNTDVTTSTWITTLLTTLLPMVLIFGILMFFLSQMNGVNNKQMQFGKTRAKKSAEETPKVRFSDVAGIDEADRDQVFELFYTGGSAADAGRSVGLGLSLCRSIVHAHGGQIRLESADPHGSRFVFTLPAEEVSSHE